MTINTAAVEAALAVRPFHVDIAEEAIVDLGRRIAAWRPPEREPVDDQSQALYWFTNTATSAARLYWQQAKTGRNFYAAADLSFPTAVTVFPEEYLQAPRSWTEKAYHNPDLLQRS